MQELKERQGVCDDASVENFSLIDDEGKVTTKG